MTSYKPGTVLRALCKFYIFQIGEDYETIYPNQLFIILFEAKDCFGNGKGYRLLTPSGRTIFAARETFHAHISPRRFELVEDI
jgi:hypothetical protein